MTSKYDVSGPLAVVVLGVYVILAWLAVSLFMRQQRRARSRRGRSAPLLRLRR